TPGERHEFIQDGGVSLDGFRSRPAQDRCPAHVLQVQFLAFGQNQLIVWCGFQNGARCQAKLDRLDSVQAGEILADDALFLAFCWHDCLLLIPNEVSYLSLSHFGRGPRRFAVDVGGGSGPEITDVETVFIRRSIRSKGNTTRVRRPPGWKQGSLPSSTRRR